jgi:hypothetical protein
MDAQGLHRFLDVVCADNRRSIVDTEEMGSE